MLNAPLNPNQPSVLIFCGQLWVFVEGQTEIIKSTKNIARILLLTIF